MSTKECIITLTCPKCGQEFARVGHESGYPYMLNSCEHYFWVRCNNTTWGRYPEWCEEQAKKALYKINDKEEWFYAVPR